VFGRRCETRVAPARRFPIGFIRFSLLAFVALLLTIGTAQQGTRAPDVADMQWRRPVPEFGNFGNQNFGATQRRGW